MQHHAQVGGEGVVDPVVLVECGESAGALWARGGEDGCGDGGFSGCVSGVFVRMKFAQKSKLDRQVGRMKMQTAGGVDVCMVLV